MTPPISNALVSVSDKTGIVDFARALVKQGVNILSTGGTAQLLKDNDLMVTDVSAHTGFEEIMAGRVKTLHPLIHGGILGRRGEDDAVMAKHNISPIDLVVVNLYPFEETIAAADCSLANAIENIDIGGPAMIRAGAKNHRHVTVVVDRGDYRLVIDHLGNGDEESLARLRFQLAVKAFAHTARYDRAIADYLQARHGEGGLDHAEALSSFPEEIKISLIKKQEMRYGENPHQKAVFYRDAANETVGQGTVTTALQIQGKPLSYNNIADTDAALECVKQFDDSPTCVIVKHANPCGVATGSTLAEAYSRAFRTDPESAFGGIIAVNRELDVDAARRIIDNQFVEVIIAPDVCEQAKQLLSAKANIRVLASGYWRNGSDQLEYKRVAGGFLVQSSDNELYQSLTTVSDRTPSKTEMENLLFAWKVAKFVKSNAIVYANDLMTIGVGAGQMSRVNSARIASIKAEQAGLQVSGAVMASDAFFPFRDGLDNAAENGVTAVIQPGGSMRDDEVIGAANAHRIAMLFTGMRHFRH